MDIPNNPKPINLKTDAMRNDTGRIQSVTPVAIPLVDIGPYTTPKELQLPVGQKILARVLGEVTDGKLQLGSDLKVTADGRIVQTTQTPEQKAAAALNDKLAQVNVGDKSASETKQWLLDVGGKYLLTKTDYALRAGQDITLQGLEGLGLKLSPNSPGATQELIRQALVRVLPQQISLQSSLEILSQLAELKPTSDALTQQLSAISAEQKQAIKAWANIMHSSLQQQALSGQSSAELASAQQIKQWLERSGLFAESNSGIRSMELNTILSESQTRILQLAGTLLTSSPSQQTANLLFRAFELAGTSLNASTLEKMSATTSDVTASVQSRLAELSMLARNLETQQNKLFMLLSATNARSTDAIGSQVLNEMTTIIGSVSTTQNAIQTLRTDLLNSGLLPPPTQQQLAALTENLVPPPGGDLKSSLVKLVVAMQTALNSDRAKSDSSSRGLTEMDLLNQAFDFPKMDLSLNKAASILADQELNTGQLLKLAAALLNRLQFNQLNSLSQAQTAPDAPAQSWNFELPFLTEQQQLVAFNLRLDKEKRRGASSAEGTEHQTQWKIVLAFELAELGPVFIETQLVPPKVKSRIWADKESTAQLIRKEQGILEAKLTKLGLEVEELQCLRGKPNPQKNPINRSLVDIQA